MDGEANPPRPPIRSVSPRDPEAESGLPMIGMDRILRDGMLPPTSAVSRIAGAVSDLVSSLCVDRHDPSGSGRAQLPRSWASVFGTASHPHRHGHPVKPVAWPSSLVTFFSERLPPPVE